MSVASRALGSKYRLLDQLGAGAMGEVWRAQDTLTGEAVAAKVLRSEYAHDPDIVGRFVRERSILVGLAHPAIVRVRDLVVEGDDLAIVMDLVEGEDLRHALRAAGTLPAPLACGVVAYLLEGLAAAHEQGALHRDVKPDNVLLTPEWHALEPGSVRLSDFGIARLAQDSTVQATGLLGTPEYMPPELFTQGTTSAASDVYAAGIVLYELLAGRSPYAGPGTAYTIGNRAVTVLPPTLPVAPGLWQLLVSMVAKDPRQRPKATDAAAELRRLGAELAEAPALPVQPTPESWQPSGDADLARAPIRTSEESPALDVGSTNLDVVFAPERSAAVAGEMAALSPLEHDGLEAGVTNLGAAPAYAAPVLQPAIEKPEEPTGSRRRRILIAVAATVAVALVAFAGVHLLGGDRAGASSAHRSAGGSGAVEATSQDTQVQGTGLKVTRAASYDAGKHQVSLTLTFAADRVALKGPFLEVVPMAKGASDCPLPQWEGTNVVANNPMSTGFSSPCGWSIPLGTLQPGEDKEVTATVDGVTLHGDPKDALASWLDDTARATEAALQDTSPTNTQYAAQRLQRVEVGTPVSATTSRGQLRVRLYPDWGHGADQLHPLFDSSVGSTTQLLEQVAGGLRNVRLYDECNGAVLIRNRSVSVVHPISACTILANVGNLSGLRSTSFPISGTAS